MRGNHLALAVLVLFTLAAYYPALRGAFIWDDNDNVVHSETKRNVRGLVRTWSDPYANQQYYPLTHSVVWIEYQLWGERTTGYHVVNVLLHAANAVLLWRLLALLSIPGALLAAGVFALHPVAVESVAWISELKNTLSGLFALWSTLCFARWACSGEASGAGKSRWPLPAAGTAASLALFACALLSKTTTSVLPLVLLLIVWWKRGRLGKNELVALSPFFVLGAAGMGLLAWIERVHVGSYGGDFPWSFAERMLIAGRALWWYAGKLGWPADLVFIPARWAVDAADPGSYLWPVAALAALGGLWLARRRLGAGPLVGALSFVIMLLPALGLVNFYFMRYSFVQDHFQYLAAPGLIALAIGGGTRVFRLSGNGGAMAHAAASAAAALILAGLWILTWRHAGHFRDEETIWRSTIARNPDCVLAHGNLGDLLAASGRAEEAERAYQAALERQSALPIIRFNLANLLAGQNRPEEAEAQYREALRLEPAFSAAHNNLGSLLAREGRLAEAKQHFELAAQSRPDNAMAWTNLGKLLLRAGDPAGAEAMFEKARALKKGTGEPLDYLPPRQRRLPPGS